MITELRIEKFKKIYDRSLFKDFDFVNFFVGENGSGKTSILNALSHLNDGGNSRRFFGPKSIVSFRKDDSNQYLHWNADNPNKTEHLGDLNPTIYLMISEDQKEKGANGIKGKVSFTQTIGIGNKSTLADFNEFMRDVGLSEVVAKKFVDQDDPFNQDNGKVIFETDQGTISPALIADGLKVLYSLKKNLNKWISEIDENSKATFIILEEPENNLHPNLQKGIPVFLNSLREKLKPEIRNKVFFFISTHSPFVISSSSSFKNQKVYPIQNGHPLILDFKNLSWKETDVTSGYNGSQCAYIVSKMLGADITDLGYPENYCILEEYSLQIILDSLRTKGIIKNFQFVSASGTAKSINYSDTIYEIEKLNTLIKCNPYYFDKYYLILDSVKLIDDNKLKSRVDKIKVRLDSRFIELSKHSLEEYYKNIDSTIGKKVLEDLESVPDENHGIIKAKYAKKIAEKLTDADTFSKLFNSELDFLLKNYS
jgi:hypothetical protein